MNQPNSNVQEMTTLAMRFWFDMAQAWMMPLSETAPWRAWMGGSPDAAWDRGAESTPTPPTGSVGEEAGANARLALSVAVASQQPSQVTVDLQPGSVVENLTVQDLREIDGNGKPPLVAVRCEATDGRLRIELSVPRDQPAGVYTGAIVDRSRREARGTVSVVVSDPAETRSDG